MAKRKRKARQTRTIELVDGKIRLTVPGSYRKLVPEELTQLVSESKGDVCGLRDTQGSATIIAEAQRLGLIASKVGKPQIVCQNSERSLAKALAGHDFVCDGFFETKVAGEAASGYRYHYQADVPLFGELVCVRHGCLMLTLTVSDARAKQRRVSPIFEGVLASVTFAE